MPDAHSNHQPPGATTDAGWERGEERRENEDGDGSLRLCRQVRLEWEDCRSVVPSKTDGWLGRSLGRAL